MGTGNTQSPVPASGSTSVAFKFKSHASLERKLMIWTLLLVTAPTFVCVWWLNGLTREAMSDHHSRNVAVLGHTLATALGARDPNVDLTAAAKQGMRAMNIDQRLAFIAVTDVNLKTLTRHIADPEAWSDYRIWMDATGAKAHMEVGRPVVLGKAGEMVAHTVPIWNPPLSSARRETTTESSATATGSAVLSTPVMEPTEDATRRLEGYVVLALRERALPTTLSELRAMQLTAACLVCLLVIPLVVWAVRQITMPLRALVDASLSLAAGEIPEPVKVERRDEVGMLADAFNFMAHRLVKAHTLLQTANDELEHKVAARTAELQRLNEQLERTAKQFETMAATDPLTSLANRRAFSASLRRAVADAERYAEDIACIMIDLDGFKQLNDTLGHQKGDELLQLTARALEESSRGSDLAARLGGDEFVLLLPRATEHVARTVAHRVAETFNEYAAAFLKDTPMEGKVTMSMGMATFNKVTVRDPEQIIAKADHALYRAKELGKNRLVIYRNGRTGLEEDAQAGADPVVTSSAAAR